MLRRTDVLKLLKEGKTVREIAESTGAKIGTIRAHKGRLIKAGLWHDKDAGLQWPLDLDQATDFLIDRLQKAKQVPELEERIKRLENQKAALENELKILKDEQQSRSDRQQRYKLAVQQGEVAEVSRN